MASIHIGTVTPSKSHIPNCKVHVEGSTVPLVCESPPWDLVSGADGVANKNLGDACGGQVHFEITVTSPKGKVGKATWDPNVPLFGDANIDVIVPGAEDEGSFVADAQAWWGSLGPLGQAGVVIGAGVVVILLLYLAFGRGGGGQGQVVVVRPRQRGR